jgi:phosphoserine phosphatase
MASFPNDLTSQPSTERADWAPFELVIFDCDSTLTDIEGIDELARLQGRGGEVAELTARAMNGDVPLEAVYTERLALLRPTREQLSQLARLYREHLLSGADQVIAALMALGRQVFIVSGGLAEAVAQFGAELGLPPDHIFAVSVDYNELSGRWWESWKHPRGRNPQETYLAHDGGPLTVGRGKMDIIRRIRQDHRGRAMLIGDGTSDLEARGAVDLFVGFGGIVARERVMAEAGVCLLTASLSPILPLALARPSVEGDWAALYADGVARLHQNLLTFRQPLARAGLLRRLA